MNPVSRRREVRAAATAAATVINALGYPENDAVNIGCLGSGDRCRRLMQSHAGVLGTRIGDVCDEWNGALEKAKVTRRERPWQECSPLLAPNSRAKLRGLFMLLQKSSVSPAIRDSLSLARSPEPSEPVGTELRRFVTRSSRNRPTGSDSEVARASSSTSFTSTKARSGTCPFVGSTYCSCFTVLRE